MTVLAIPTSNDAYSTQRTDLEGKEYVLSFQWSSRQETWFMDVADTEGEPIVQGLKLLIGVNLLRRVVDARKPPGTLFVYSRTLDDSPPGIDDFLAGGRCELTYITSDDDTP